MAKLITTPDPLTYVSFPITKFERNADGDLLVYGKATDGTVDSDEQIVDPEWSAKALDTWLTTGGNVRVMHSAQHLPAGKGVELDTTKGDGHWVRSLVVEPTAQRLVEKRVLQAYSIGISNPKIIRDRVAKGGRIVGGEISELSLVDRPANKNCGIVLVKSADGVTGEDVQELFGDVDEPLILGDATLTKGASTDEDAEDEDEADEDVDDDQGDEDDQDDTDAFKSARAEWLAREPGGPTGGSTQTGTDFLAKRAAWDKWNTEGETLGLDVDDAEHRELYLSQRPAPAPADTVVVKGAKACPNPDCSATHDADSKLRRCEECGTKLPKATKGKKTKGLFDISFDGALLDSVAKSDRPFPADVHPAGGHREPDGGDVERLEADAGMHTDPDRTADQVPAAVKNAGPSYAVKRMHDALCAGFHWDQVAAEYPALKSVADAVDPDWFRVQVAGALAKGDMPLVQLRAGNAQSADALAKGAVEPAMLADARAELHKAFAELHPDADVQVKTITPGQFQRPYLSAGHAPLTAPSSRPANVPPSARVPDPDDFDRPLITAGHEAASPGDRGDNLATTSVASGSSRHFYTTASREAARGALQALHDHIQTTFPDMCPLAASKSVMPADMGDSNVPRPITPTAPPKAPGEKSVDVHGGKTAGAPSKKEIRRLIKAAVAEATAVATAEVGAVYKSQINALQAEIDKLGAQPDPTQAPLRGVVRQAAKANGTVAPVERQSLVEKAQAQADSTREEEIAYLRKFVNHPQLAMRDAAEQRLGELLNATP